MKRRVTKNCYVVNPTTQERVSDLAEFLTDALLKSERYPGLSIFRKEAHWDPEFVGAVDMALVQGASSKPSWYWPIRGDELGRRHSERLFEPRYANLRDAVIASMRLNDGTGAYVLRHPRGPYEHVTEVGIRVLSWYDHKLSTGATEEWWIKWFQQAKTGPAVLWAGADDPMD